jgi:methionyl-tRNA formyltransferase
MTPGVDTGAIAYEARFPLTDADTGLSASTRCVKEGIPLVERLLADAAANTIPKIAQDLTKRRVYKRRDVPHAGVIDWALPAKVIDAFVRAADFYPMPSPWGHPKAMLEGKEVQVAKVVRTGQRADAPPGTVRRSAGAVEVATADEWLALKRLRVAERYVAAA